MALSDELVVRYLLQLTESHPPLAWRAQDAGGFRADLNGVRIELAEVPTRAGSYWWLELRSGFETVYIQEPQSVAVFGTRYSSDTERDLAGNMRELARVVTDQCSDRNLRSDAHRDEIRESIFRQVMFGTES